MSKERKTYTYRCVNCDERYEFSHVQTYKNCTGCEERAEIRLDSIEIVDDNLSLVDKADIEHQKNWK